MPTESSAVDMRDSLQETNQHKKINTTLFNAVSPVLLITLTFSSDNQSNLSAFWTGLLEQ